MQALHTPTLDHTSARALWKSMQAQIAAQGPGGRVAVRAWSKLLALSLCLVGLLGLAWSAGSTGLALLWCVLLALVLAQFAFLGHDAGHRAVHRGGFWRGLVGQLCMTVVTGMAFEEWFGRHAAHHSHCQDEALDPDMDVSLVVSLTENAARTQRGLGRWLARHQHVHVWFLSLLFAFSQRHLSQWGALLAPRRHLRDLAALGLHIVLWCWLPHALLDVAWSRVALVYCAPMLVLGPYLAAIFWLNHIGMPLVRSGDSTSFLEHQTVTSRTVLSPPKLDWLFGGLNYQTEHHLFPQVPAAQLARVQPIVQATLAGTPLRYNAVGFGAAVRAVAAHFRQVARSA
jgi:fatty acid desaturase